MSNTESELKLRLVDPACVHDLLNAPLLRELSTEPTFKHTLETTYYDTADQHLLRSRLSYRLRLADGEWTATVKADGTSDGGLHQRTEYNVPVDSALPNIEPFLSTDIGTRLAEAVGDEPLAAIFSTCFERHIINVITPCGSNIELALDDGHIIAGDNQQKILELELELKDGQPQALVWLGATLAEDFSFLPEQDSKLYRATVLAGLADSIGHDAPLPFPLKKASASLPAHQGLGHIIIYHIHAAVRAQQAYLESPDDIETLHNFRIVFRKLRALLQFAKPLMPAEEYAAWQAKLTAWGEKFGYVRDLDVFNLNWGEMNDYMTKLLPNLAGKPALSAILADKRQIARTNLHDTIAAGQLTPLLLGLWTFVESWANSKTTEPMPSFKEFALDRLTRWLSQFLKLGTALDPANLNAAHDLRIDAKRLRYTLESLAPVLPANAQLLSKRLEKLQDLLGQIQDITFTPPLLHELVKASASRLTHRDAGLITGWQLARSSTAYNSWDKAWNKVKKTASKIKKLKPLDNGHLNRRSPEL